MRRFMAATGRTILGVLSRRLLVMLLLAALPVGFCIVRLRPAWESWSYYNDIIRSSPVSPESYDDRLMVAANLRQEYLVETLLWSGAVVGALVLVFPFVWGIDYLARTSRTIDPSGLRLRTSTPLQAESMTPRQDGPSARSEGHSPGRPPSPVGTYAIVQRPNQELVLRAMNMYRDVMRSLVLDRLRQAYGQNAGHAISASLSDEAADNFERDLAGNSGVLEETLDVGHFRPIVENNWDRCFAAQFGHDRTIFGTLGWINGARNQAAHPGTGDLPREEVVAAMNNIGKVLNHVGATDISHTLEGLKAQAVRAPAPIAHGAASVRSSRTISKCANARCESFNEHAMDGSGESSLRCGSCSAEYSSKTFDVVRIGPYREGAQQPQTPNPFTHTLRIRLPDGAEDLFDLQFGHQVEADRGDTITVSYDAKGELIYLLNRIIDRTWYFGGGDYRAFRQRPTSYFVILICLWVLSGSAWLVYSIWFRQ